MKDRTSSHKQILKSTSIVGGAQVANIIINVIKTKMVAILLGPVGVGTIGILQSIIDLVRNGTGFGINFSGVRDIAEANNSEDAFKISKTIHILKRWALLTGILGLIITILFSANLSVFSFQDTKHIKWILCISVVLLVTSISSANLALLQGMQKIKLMAIANIIGSLGGLIISVVLIWFFKIDGVVMSIIASAILMLIVSFFFTREIRMSPIQLSWKDTFRGGVDMAKMGFYIVVAGFISTITLYAIRSFITAKSGLEDVGIFQSSWTITNTYVNIILFAMLADFYPRLSIIHEDKIASNKLLNEQIEMALLISIPLVIGLISLSPYVLRILYSSRFLTGIDVLILQLSASIFLIVSWGLGVTFLAKRSGTLIIISEILWCSFFGGTIYWGWDRLGIVILGYGFLMAHFVKFIFVLLMVKRIFSFKFSLANLQQLFVFTSLIVFQLFCIYYFVGTSKIITQSIILIIAIVYSLYKLNKIIGIVQIINRIREKI